MRVRYAPALMAVTTVLAGTAFAGIPAGYYDPASGLEGEALQSALHGIIDDHESISYEDIWLAFYTTDDRPDGFVWDMYSDVPGGTPPYLYTFFDDEGGSASAEGQGYNRKHSWPKSWFGDQAPMNTDLFHIVPTDIYVNNRRGNFPYGEVASPTWTSLNGSRLGPCSWPGYSGTVFEPIDAFKGDFARNYFYMATRYYGEDAAWPSGNGMTDGAQLLEWAEGMLIAWHLSDPVGAKELDRNEAVYAIQENRNPFIDHPEYVLMMYEPTGIEYPDEAPSLVAAAASPNPFSGSVGIVFTLSAPAEVDLTVYDVYGREVVAVLDDAAYCAGEHVVPWDGAGGSGEAVPPGVYLCRIAVPGAGSVCQVLKL